MKGDIKHYSLVQNSDPHEFFKECTSATEMYQKQNLHVEVQYSTHFDERFRDHYYSALLIARSK